MCPSTICSAGSRVYFYGSSIATLLDKDWEQIYIASYEVFRQSWLLGLNMTFIAHVLTNGLDPYFLWQYQEDSPCPRGCSKAREVGSAVD